MRILFRFHSVGNGELTLLVEILDAAVLGG
jgi:hypothetical protein